MAVTPADRVRAALALDRADRPPVAWWGHTFREEWSPEELAAATVDRQRRYGWDFVKLQPRATCFAEAFGSEYRASGTAVDAPVLVRAAVTDATGWADVRTVDAEGGAPLADQVEAVRLVREELGPDVPLLQTVFSPLTVAGYLVGEDRSRVVQDLRADPEAVGSALDAIASLLMGFAARSVAAGADGIFFAISGYASRDVVPLGEYEDRALGHDRRVLESLPEASWFNVLHLCGADIEFELASALPAHAVSWSAFERGNPSLEDGFRRSGRAVMDGVSHTGTLVTGSAEEVAGEVRIAAATSGGRGVLVAPGCSVPPEAPEENVRAVRGAHEEGGAHDRA